MALSTSIRSSSSSGTRLVAGPVGERSVRDLVAQGEPAGAAPEQRLHEREGGQVFQGTGAGVAHLRGSRAGDVGGPGRSAGHGAGVIARIHDAVLGKADVEWRRRWWIGACRVNHGRPATGVSGTQRDDGAAR